MLGEMEQLGLADRNGVFFFFLHVLCLYATLWVMTDLSAFTYKNLARLDAP